MKKTLTITALLIGAVSGYSQGQMNFTGYNSGNPGSYQIFNVNTINADNNTTVTYGGYTVSEEQGNTSAASGPSSKENPKGSTVYSGTALAGTGFSAQLLAAAGTGDPLSELSPLTGTGGGNTGILNFYTATAAAGFITGSSTTSIPGTSTGAPGATIAIAAWNNEGGTVTSLAMAESLGDPWGISALANITTTFTPTTPAALSTASDLNLSFCLGNEIPEPSTIALGVMGASALLFRRRK